MNKKACAYIQNHINWCWAVAAKIVGMEYCRQNNLALGCINEFAPDVVRNDLTGLRPQFCGMENGRLTVDAIQSDIVNQAKDKDKNPLGNRPEGDDGKARALRYVVGGDIKSNKVSVIVCGYFYDSRDLLESSADQIEKTIDYGNCFIGNFKKQGGCFHSAVLLPLSKTRLRLYDPWDGYQSDFSVEQLFRSGFLTNQGVGVIKWIQYIDKSNLSGNDGRRL